MAAGFAGANQRAAIAAKTGPARIVWLGVRQESLLYDRARKSTLGGDHQRACEAGGRIACFAGLLSRTLSVTGLRIKSTTFPALPTDLPNRRRALPRQPGCSPSSGVKSGRRCRSN